MRGDGYERAAFAWSDPLGFPGVWTDASSTVAAQEPGGHGRENADAGRKMDGETKER